MRTIAIGLLGLAGCSGPPTPEPAPAPAKVTAARAPTRAPEVAAWPLPEHVLHPWDTALLMIDPMHLTAAQRLQRAHARRRQIGLNPDSPTGKALDDLAKAASEGQIDPEAARGVVFTAPGVERKPKPGDAPPAGVDHEPRP